MKSLEQIKNEYALSKKYKSWEDFCFIANDSMFARAVDEIATLYAEYRMQFMLHVKFKVKPVQNELMLGRLG